MTEEKTTTDSGEASPPESGGTGQDTATAQPTGTGDTATEAGTDSGTADAGTGAAAGSGGKKSWRGRSRADKPARSAKAEKGAKTAKNEKSGTTDTADSGEAEKTEKTEKQPKQKREKQVAEKKRRTPGHGMGVGQIRTLVARIVWVVCLVFALLLALTALFIALKANADNEAVRFIVDAADKVDLGVFDLRNPIKDFDTGEGPSTDTKTALFNYGIGAVVWLVIGRIGDRVIRP